MGTVPMGSSLDSEDQQGANDGGEVAEKEIDGRWLFHATVMRAGARAQVAVTTAARVQGAAL